MASARSRAPYMAPAASPARGFLLDANGVGLGRFGFKRGDAGLRGDAAGIAARGEDEAGGRGIAGESAESAFGERDAAAGERAVDLTGGELNLRHRGVTAERGRAGLGTKAGGA